MIYHIEKQKFFVLKSFFDDEKDKLSNRECQNYSYIHSHRCDVISSDYL